MGCTSRTLDPLAYSRRWLTTCWKPTLDQTKVRGGWLGEGHERANGTNWRCCARVVSKTMVAGSGGKG